MAVLSRRGFIGSVAAAGTVAALPSGQAQAQTPQRSTRFSHGLVLSGGGARGAYEAGIIGALAAAAGVKDGEPLTPYGFVCGTSIGALNGWMVATGQYSKLRTLWNEIAGQHILQVKPEFAKIRNPNSGILTRFGQAISLLNGLHTNVRAVFQTEPVLAFIQSHVDTTLPVLMPFVWTSTNVSNQRTEYFYRVPQAISSERRGLLLDIFQRTIGPSGRLREAPQDYLPHTLLASAAIPVVFDPVVLPSADGTRMDQYVDGGVASNTPVSLARTVARHLDVVILDPLFEPQSYDNAVEIGLAVFGTMQQRILESEIRAAFFESLGTRDFNTSTMSPDQISALRTYLSGAGSTELAYIRPKQTLPLGVGAFDNAAGIQEAMQLGQNDASGGFHLFTLADFLSA